MQKKTNEESDLYRLIIDNVNDLISVLDKDLKLIYINDIIQKISGFSKEEVLNKNPMDFVHPDDIKRVGKLVKVVSKTGFASGELRQRRKDNSYVWCEVKAKRIVDKNGDINFVLISRDITDRKIAEKAEQLLRESEEKYRLVSENAYDIISVLNDKFKFEYVNELPLFKMLGYSSSEFLGKNPLKFSHPDHHESMLEGFKNRFEMEGRGPIETRMRHKDGHYIWCETSGNIFTGMNGEQKVLLITRDVSERKAAQEKLRESEKKYREAYDRASLYKDLFAHDMNNVFNIIHSSMELSSLYLNSPDALKKIKKLHEIVKVQVAKGAKLISNVQKLSDLEELKIPLKLIKTNKILNEAIKFIYGSFQTKKIDIQINDINKDITIQANALLIDVFENLLINAVKYNDNPIIEIIIQISKVKKNDRNYHKFEFIDNGIGIEDFKKNLIFLRGQLKEKGIKGIKGMGIGLSLVERILDSYEGEIWVEDKVKGDYSKGSNFILLIPEVA